MGALAHAPTWGIFLGWATATLAASNRETSPRSLVRGLVVGALFGVLALWLQEALGTLLGGLFPVWVPPLAVLAGLNPLLILLGRIKGFAAVPGMFIAFATVFAAHFAGDLPLLHSIAMTGAAGVAMNLLGVLFHQAYLRMTSPPGNAAPDR